MSGTVTRIREFPDVIQDIRKAIDGIKADTTSQAEVRDTIKNVKAALTDLTGIVAKLLESRHTH